MALKLRVAGIGGALCNVRLAAEASHRTLQASIEAETGIPISCQRLFDGTAELRCDGDVLSMRSAHAQRGHATLLLVRRVPEQAAWLEQVKATDAEEVCDWCARAPPAALEDRDVVLAAVARDGSALRFASTGLQADAEVALAAGRQDWTALEFASPKIWADSASLVAAIRHDARALRFAPKDAQADREVVMLAVAQNGRALRYASVDLQGDREVVMAAVLQDWSALQFASPELRADAEVVMTATTQSWQSLLLVAPGSRVEIVRKSWRSFRAACHRRRSLRSPGSK